MTHIHSKRLAAGSTAALLVLSLTGCASISEKWQSFRKKDAQQPSALTQIQVSQQLQQIWSTSTAATPQYDPLRFVLAGDTQQGIYSAGSDGQVTALQNNQKRWSVRPSKELSSGVALGADVVVVGNTKGQLFALDRQSGATRWQKQLTGAILAPGLVVQQRIITVTNDGTVYAHDAASGQVLWTYNLPDVSLSVRGYAQPVLVDQRNVAIATANGYIVLIDSLTGVPQWQQRVAVATGRGDMARLVDIDAAPQVTDGKLISVSYQGQLTTLDLAEQRVLWSQDISSLNSPATDGQAVYVATTDGHLRAFALADGRPLWDNDQLLNRQLSNPVVLGSTVVVGDYDGVLHLLDPQTGKLVGRERTRGAVRTLQVQGQQLWVSTTSGQYSIWQKR